VEAAGHRLVAALPLDGSDPRPRLRSNPCSRAIPRSRRLWPPSPPPRILASSTRTLPCPVPNPLRPCAGAGPDPFPIPRFLLSHHGTTKQDWLEASGRRASSSRPSLVPVHAANSPGGAEKKQQGGRSSASSRRCGGAEGDGPSTATTQHRKRMKGPSMERRSWATV
jgi:hypothetical protein